MTTGIEAQTSVDWQALLGWTIPNRLPVPAECTVRPVLERWAAATPDKIFVMFEDGTHWTYARLHDEVRQTAAALADWGVATGDPVLNWLPNGADHLRFWLAANYIGAIHVPLSTAARGGELEHVFTNSGARVLIADRSLAAQLSILDLAAVCTVALIGEGAAELAIDARIVDGAAMNLNAEDLPVAPLDCADIAMIIYTSGTTGPPKGVCNPYAQFWMLAKAQNGYLTADDRVMISTSLSHISTTSMVMAALYAHASIALFDRFSAAQFWQRLRATGSTAVPGMGPAMLAMLLKAPAEATDRDHALRIINVRAPGEAVRQFSARFGVDFFAAFGMTEASCVTLSARNAMIDGSCGRARPGMEVRLVDARDIEVPDGAIGEIILRSDLPWTLNAGYHNEPAATAQAWRNGWFHTGDLASRDRDGNYTFHDRSKDCIRRRGENISSQEVEREALSFPTVQNAAAIGVPGDFEDEEVLLVVEPLADNHVDPTALVGFISERLSYFKVPRYICVRHDLPRTTFGKVRKFQLMQDIVLADCWDRERDGAGRPASNRKETQNGAS